MTGRRKDFESVFWTKRKKRICSVGLAFLAAAFSIWSGTPWSAAAALAMAASAVGDGLLAGYPKRFQRVKNKLIKGGLAFWAAHCLYMLALVLYSGQRIRSILPHFPLPALGYFFLSCLHGYRFFFRAASHTSLSFFAAAMVYLLTVGAHGALAICVSLQTGGPIWLSAIGAGLFYLSDAVLLANKYRPGTGKDCSSLVWFTYAPAQLCLIAGLFLAR